MISGLTKEGWTARPSGLYVPAAAPTPLRRDKPIAVGFFSGAGGMDLGFTEAGFHVAAAVEWSLDAACTYLCNLGGPDTVVHLDDPQRWPAWEKYMGDERRRWVRAGAPEGFGGAGTGWIANSDHRNCPDDHEGVTAPNQCFGCHWTPGRCGCARCCDAQPCEHFWIADVRNLTGAEILGALGMKPGEVDAVIGGPPCQGFSMAGSRNVMDPRNSLVFEFARLILEINPKTMVMENVPGMLSMVTPEGVPVVDAFCRVLSDGGFSTYDALRRGLEQQAGTYGAVRDDNGERKKASKATDPEPDENALFDVTVSA